MANNSHSGPGGPVRGRGDYEALGPRGRDAHDRAMAALRYMRSEGMSLSRAAELAGTTPGTVRRFAGPALVQRGRHAEVAESDRLYRRMTVLGPEGPVDVDVRGSRTASLIGSHFNAVGRYLATGDPAVLAPYRGVVVDGVPLLTDPSLIEQLAAQRELDIDDIYPHT